MEQKIRAPVEIIDQLKTGESNEKTDNIDNYYSHYFNSFVLLGLFLVEDDQDILNVYFKNFHEKTYPSYRGHRNAMLNALYLVGAKKTTRTIRPNSINNFFFASFQFCQTRFF